MKNLVLLLFFFFAFLALSAQTYKADPATGNLEYVEVVNVPGVDTDELYKRLEHWFNTFYVNPASVIESRKEEESIKGRHSININKANDKGLEIRMGMVRYDIEVGVKEGRYRYMINEIFLLQSPKLYIQEWLKDGPEKAQNAKYFAQVTSYMDDLIKNLKATMAKPVPEDDGDEW